MRMMLIALPFALLAAACNHMDDGMSDMRGAVGAARVENTRHHEAAAAAGTMADMMAELAQHEMMMGDAMGMMDGSMDGMHHCGGGDMAPMHEMMGAMRDRMTAHRETLEGTTKLEDARAECEAHHAAMAEMLDAMDGAMGTMGGGCM